MTPRVFFQEMVKAMPSLEETKVVRKVEVIGTLHDDQLIRCLYFLCLPCTVCDS